MFISLQELELRDLEFSVEVPASLGGDSEHGWRAKGPLKATGRAELVSRTLEEIRVSGHLSVTLEGACDRCLDPVEETVDTDFDVVYRPDRFANPEADELEILKSESDIAFYSGSGIELNDVLREQVMLALPMQSLCRRDCRGICPVCGQNRNTTACECQVKPVDDRWSGLKEIRL